MDDERDVEVFERIPWESLENKTDRRWLAYLGAGVLVLGAVGVSIGRQMGHDPQPVSASLPSTSTIPAPEAPTTTMDVAATPAPPTTWSEADLMALPVDSVETAARAVAEWYVVDYFTRDDPEGDRSFVEWARAAALEWDTPSTASVTVLVRRLAAVGDAPYRRLEVEAWEVGMDLGDDGWSVVPGPIPRETPELSMSEGAGTESPDHAAGQETEWVDPAGLSWRIRETTPPGP